MYNLVFPSRCDELSRFRRPNNGPHPPAVIIASIAPAPVGCRPLFGLLLFDRCFKFCLASLKFIQALLQGHHFLLDSA